MATTTLTATRQSTRQPDQVRKISIIYEKLDRTDGSARFSFGSTQALASISGPIEVRLANENPSKATFEVTVRPLSSTPGTESKSLATTLRSMLTPSLFLTQNPRTMIQLVVQAMNVNPGGTGFSPGMTAAMINASSLALLNAAVPMSGLVCAVAVGYSSSAKSLVLDPPEEEKCTGSGCFAFMFSVGEESEVWSNWRSSVGFDERELSEAKTLARNGAREVWVKVKESLGEVPSKELDDDDDDASMEI